MQASTFMTKYPYRFTALLVTAITVTYLSAGTTATLLKLPAGNTASVYFFANLLLALVGTVLLSKLRWWKTIGFRALTPVRDLRLYWLPFTLVLVNLSFGVAVTGVGRVVYLLALAALIGFVEEVFFRGLILRALASRGLWQAAFISSVLFGVLHSLNVLGGASPLATVLQVGYALAIGFGYAAVTLRTGVIWPLVLIHALTDFASFLATNGGSSSSATATDMLITALYIVTFMGYGILMLRSTLPWAHATLQSSKQTRGGN